MQNETDVIIIGGGVVGGAIAYYLTALGQRVIVLEKKGVAAGASGANLGQISLTDREPGTELEWALESLSLYRGYAERGEFETELKQTGGLFLFYQEEELAAAERLIQPHAARGLDVRILRGEEVLMQEPLMNPAAVAGAAYCAEEGGLNPLLVTLGFMDRAVSRGARLCQNVRVMGFSCDRSGQIQAVETDSGTFRAQQVVVATGAWTKELVAGLGLNYPIYFNRANVMITQAVPPCVHGPIAPGGFLTGTLSGEKWTMLGVMQHKNGTICIGQDTSVFDVENKGVSYDGVTGMARLFAQHFPSLQDTEVLRTWSAPTPYTADGAPLFGYSKKHPNLFLAAGLKGAFSVAPTAGKTAAELLTTGASTYDCTAFSPARFEQEAENEN